MHSTAAHPIDRHRSPPPRVHPRAVPMDAPTRFACESVWRHERPLLEVLADEYGHMRLDQLEGSYGWCIRYSQEHRREALGIETLGELLTLFENDSVLPLPYLMHLSIHRNLPRLRRFFVDPPQFRPNWATAPWADRIGGPELFIGQQGTGFGPIHIDHVAVHVGFFQVSGEKQFLLFPPEDGQYLYRYRGAEFPWQLRNSRICRFDDDVYERFPLLRNASPRRITLHAGEALFMPANWWHTTLNLTDSVSYSVRIVNGSNVLSMLGEYARGIPRVLVSDTIRPRRTAAGERAHGQRMFSDILRRMPVWSHLL